MNNSLVIVRDILAALHACMCVGEGSGGKGRGEGCTLCCLKLLNRWLQCVCVCGSAFELYMSL